GSAHRPAGSATRLPQPQKPRRPPLGPGLDADLTIDVDSTICQTYGTKKQGATFGYTKVRGYHPLLATLASTGEVLHARMRGGNAGSARGAGTFVRETISRVRQAGATGALGVRADSAFYSRGFVTACRDHGARFSVTVKMLKPIREAIDAIGEEDWREIPYWLEGGAEVAETSYTAFKDTKDRVTLRLIVRRVRPTPGSQLALDVVFDYHPVLTDRDGHMLVIEADHRRHAVVELAIRDVKAGGLAHLPSGKFNANAAWLALAVVAHNLARWTLAASGGDWSEATTETFRTKVVSMPARLVHSARTLKLRAPTNWPWRQAFETALTTIRTIPIPAPT
ncbi:MAG: IS1380 family transposase, partial [Acidimicrobiia bacterium]|nr:IS1380 family transposase [Acidimicrobiia bacterium]